MGLKDKRLSSKRLKKTVLRHSGPRYYGSGAEEGIPGARLAGKRCTRCSIHDIIIRVPRYRSERRYTSYAGATAVRALVPNPTYQGQGLRPQHLEHEIELKKMERGEANKEEQ